MAAHEDWLARLNRWWQRAVGFALFRLALVVATGIFLSFSYRAVNHDFPPRYDFSLPIDRSIPFLPWTGLIYWSYFGLFIGGAIVLPAHRFTRLWVAVLACNLSAYLFYMVFTAHVPHPDITWVQPSWLNDLYRGFYLLDEPGNTLPSLHCTQAALLGWNIRKHHWGWLAWGVLISLSTLTTKEHVLADLLAGWLLAATAQWLIVRTDDIDEPARQPLPDPLDATA